MENGLEKGRAGSREPSEEAVAVAHVRDDTGLVLGGGCGGGKGKRFNSKQRVGMAGLRAGACGEHGMDEPRFLV